jgi:hypothetical protein
MTNILIDKTAFDELLDHVEPAEGISYVIAGDGGRYIEGLGEVEYVEITKLTSAVWPAVPEVPEEYRAELHTTILEGCSYCGDLDEETAGCRNCSGPLVDDFGNCIDVFCCGE